MKTSILSNINVDPIINNLKNSYEIVEIPGYGNWIESIIDENTLLANNKVTNIFIIIDGFELYSQLTSLKKTEAELDNIFRIVKNFLEHYNDKTVYLSNLDMNSRIIEPMEHNSLFRFQNMWNSRLLHYVDNLDRLKIFDLNSIISQSERKQFYDEKMWYLGRVKFTNIGSELVSKNIAKILHYKINSRKKCLVLDLDNTLWGGVLGEVGPQNINISKTGPYRVFRDFQYEIKRLKDTGVLLAIASKNYIEAVERVFQVNQDIILKLDDFVSIKANWNPKSQNIIEIREELNIGFDSIVFVDDNPFEREEVKNNLVDVIVPEFPQRIVDMKNFAVNLFDEYFFTEKLTNSDKNKTKQIKNFIKFNTEKRDSTNIIDYLNSLDMKVKININDLKNIDRIAQLINKTNQFNLTLNRYDKEYLMNFMNNGNLIFTGELEDKFGTHGLSILAMVEVSENDAELTNFLMSCRAMGRYLEYRFIKEIFGLLLRKNIHKIHANYSKSIKNKIVKDFIENVGFKLMLDKNTHSRYDYDLNDNFKPKSNLRIMVEYS